MRRWITVLLIFAIVISLGGCSEEWRKKFVRKKKEVVKRPRIYQEKKYKKEPSEQLYNKHYNYCISWLSELEQGLGQNSKKDARCIEEALGQIKEMQGILLPEKGLELDKHIKRLKDVQDIIIKQDLTQANMDYVRSSVEREERFLRSEFYYNKIKKFMKSSFEDEDLEVTVGP